MSALDDIEAAAGALNALTVQEAAQAAAISAAVAAALKATVAIGRMVYVDAVAGLDTNDGSTPALAVQTLQAAAALLSAGQFGTFVLCSDVTLAAPLTVNGTVQVTSQGVQPGGSVAGTRHAVKIPPAAVGAGLIPCAIYTGVGSTLGFYACDVQVGAVTAASGVINGTGNLFFELGQITFDPGMTSPFIFSGFGTYAYFISETMPASYAGRLFQQVAAGANPNSLYLRTNITSA